MEQQLVEANEKFEKQTEAGKLVESPLKSCRRSIRKKRKTQRTYGSIRQREERNHV